MSNTHSNGKKKKGPKSHSLFSLSLGCTCKDMKAISVHIPSSTTKTTDNPNSVSNNSLPKLGNPELAAAEKQESTFSTLLQELNELERSVKDWGGRNSSNKGRIEESVVIVKESNDPLGDFKRSMLQMVVENGIVDRDEMEELLQRFLVLNSLENHSVIVRAFMELWHEVFAEAEETPREFELTLDKSGQ